MKRRELIKVFERNGWWLLRHGKKHDMYTNGTKCEPVARHQDINENLAKVIIERQGLK